MAATSRTRRLWTAEEDQTLREEANKQQQVVDGAIKDWNRVARQLPDRSNKDCRKRWSKIGKDVKRGSWNDEEDSRLIQAIQRFGLRWTKVADSVGSRHADQCAKRWTQSLAPDASHEDDNNEQTDAWRPASLCGQESLVQQTPAPCHSNSKPDVPRRKTAPSSMPSASSRVMRERLPGMLSDQAGGDEGEESDGEDDENEDNDDLSHDVGLGTHINQQNFEKDDARARHLQMAHNSFPMVHWDPAGPSSYGAGTMMLDGSTKSIASYPGTAASHTRGSTDASSSNIETFHPYSSGGFAPSDGCQDMGGMENAMPYSNSMMTDASFLQSSSMAFSNSNSLQPSSSTLLESYLPLEQQNTSQSSSGDFSSPNPSMSPSSNSRTVLEMENLSQNALCKIMAIAIENKSKVKLETWH